jgi:hypothetical protein
MGRRGERAGRKKRSQKVEMVEGTLEERRKWNLK